MKILYLITQSELGGAQNFVFDLASTLAKKNISITVGVGNSGYLTEKLKKEHIPFVLFKNLARSKNPFKNIFYIFEIKKYLDNNDFDIIHLNSSNALLGSIGAKLSTKKPKTIFTYHGLSILDENYKINILAKNLYKHYFKILMNFIDISVFVCQSNLETIKKLGIETNSHVIFNSKNNIEFYSKEKAREIIKQSTNIDFEKSFTLGSIGRLSYQKNYKFLISIFPKILKKMPEMKLLIIGDGEERKKLQNLIKKNNLEKQIFLIGSKDNAHKLLPAFDLFVLPSIYEGMSITIIEVLFAGIPMLVSDVGGNKETMKKTEEQIYKLNSEQEFIEKLYIIFKSDILKNELIKDNLNFSSRFTTDEMTSSYFQIYKSLTQK